MVSSSASPSGGFMRRSVITASNGAASMRRSASSPPPTKLASCPASRRSSAVSSAFRISSSTTSTRIGVPSSRAAPGHAHDAGRADPGLTLYHEIAPGGLYQPSREKETQPRAARLRREERVADAARDLGRHARSGVADRELELTAALGARHLEPAALRHRLERVQDQVEEHLLQRLEVERDRGVAVEPVARHRHLAHAELVVEQV